MARLRCDIVVGSLPPPGGPPNALLAPVSLVVVANSPGSARFGLRLARPGNPGDVLAEAVLEVHVAR